MSVIKYRHPAMPDLTWNGKGRQPKWVEAYLANGGALVSLDVEVQGKHGQILSDSGIDLRVIEQGIDLGIGDPQVSLGTKLFAQRIVAGLVEVPAVADRELLQAIEAERQAQSLVRLDAGNGGDPVAMLVASHTDASQSHLDLCLREFGFVSMTADEFLQAGIDELNQSVIRACRAGTAFWAAQEALKNTDYADGVVVNFKDWIAEAGLTETRVYESIRLAKFYSRLPNDKRSQLLTMGKKPALLLASLPQEVIDRSAESGNDLIDKADLMTVSELKEEIKRLERCAKNLDAEVERKDSQIKRLTTAKSRTTDFLLRTEEIREECMALQKEVELPINGLQKLFDEVNAEDPSLPEWRIQIEQIWVTAHAVCARAEDMLFRLQETVRVSDMPERVTGQHQLSAAEAERWLLDWPAIENRYEAAKALRQEKRDAAKPKGPGRPKGSSNKAGEE